MDPFISITFFIFIYYNIIILQIASFYQIFNHFTKFFWFKFVIATEAPIFVKTDVVRIWWPRILFHYLLREIIFFTHACEG